MDQIASTTDRIPRFAASLEVAAPDLTDPAVNQSTDLPPAILEIVESACRAHGLEPLLVRLLSQRGRATLRIVIDRDEATAPASIDDGSGVTVGDCSRVSRDISTALDLHEELLPGRYHLEVSSPGLERPLVRLRDYERFQGREAKLRIQTAVHGRRRFTGVLMGLKGEEVRIEVEGEEVLVPFADITDAHLVYRFD